MSSGKIVEVIDEYRKRIAPLAKKWWEWKKGEGSGDGSAREEKEDDGKEDGVA